MGNEEQGTIPKPDATDEDREETGGTENEEQGTNPKPDATDEHREEAEGTGNDEGTIPKPDVTDEHREKAKEMAKAYEDDRPTIGLPGTSNTVTGQAVSDWVDDDGNPKFGEVKDGEGVKREDVMGVRKKNMGEEDEEDDKDDKATTKASSDED